MGREIRRVPPDWHHPKYTADDTPRQDWIGHYRPIYDEDYQSACERWYREAAEWTPNETCRWYHEWNGNPPDETRYRDRQWSAEEAAHYQVYETVSEGTPVTPHFATKEELIEYLAEHGDFWDQKRGDGSWSRQAAERFVRNEWAPSMIATLSSEGTSVFMPRDGSPGDAS